MPRIEGPLKAAETAVLAVNMTNAFWPEGADHVCSFIAECKNKGVRTVYASVAFRADGIDRTENMRRVYGSDTLIQGTRDTQLLDALIPDEEDIFVTMRSISPFHDTDLEIVLRCSGIKNLIIVGARTDCECFSAARDAFNRDLTVIVLEDMTQTFGQKSYYVQDDGFTPHDYHVQFLNNLFMVMNADIQQSEQALRIIK